MSFVGKLFMVKIGVAFGDARLLPNLLKPLFPGFAFGTKLSERLTLPLQSLDRFIFGEFGVADLGLQVAHDALSFRQQPFGFIACGGFGGQRRLGPLQAAAGGGWRCGDATMGGCFVSLVPTQDRHGDIAVLDEAAAVQSATEPIAQADRLVRPFGLRSVSL